MKVNNFSTTAIDVMFAGEDLYRLSCDVCVSIWTDEGLIEWELKTGFPTNMRSGSHVIDGIIPKFSKNQKYNAALLCHDAAYTKCDKDGNNYLSKNLADEMLRQMVVLSREVGTFKANLMFKMLKWFGNSAYDCPNEGQYAGAEKYMKFYWTHIIKQ